MTAIDLNADLGEGFGRWVLGDDAAMLNLVSSANIACGFHAGDPAGLLDTVRSATAAGVSIGAQVGYRDLVGFGRRFVDVERRDLVADVIYQIGALDALARSCGGRVTYVKPHGALYNAVVHHAEQALAVVDAVGALDPGLAVLGLPGSVFLAAAEGAGLRTVSEAFADRGYRRDGTLLPRREPGAVLSDPEAVAARVVRLVQRGLIDAVDGTAISVRAESVCVHGDSPGAVAMAQAVRTALTGAGVAVLPFVRVP